MNFQVNFENKNYKLIKQIYICCERMKILENELLDYKVDSSWAYLI